MSDHYYSKNLSSKSKPRQIQVNFQGRTISLTSDEGVFSKNKMDYGSKVLTKAFIQNTNYKNQPARILELGSGYGPIAILLAMENPDWQIDGLEVNERAYNLSIHNKNELNLDNVNFINQDGLSFRSDEHYQAVVTNPPFRAGKRIVHGFVDKAYDLLCEGGELYLVVQKKQGAPSLKKYMEEVFSNVERVSLDKGYWVLVSYKKNK